jgi:hypothetical protein
MPTLPKMKFHPAVKKHFSVRALVSLLMLVVDYEVPVDCNTADVFNAWVKVIQTQWSTWHRETARNWAQDRRLIASDHFVDKPHPRPKCIDSLPYRKEFTMKEMSDAVAMLEANHVPPAPHGHYYIKYGRAGSAAAVGGQNGAGDRRPRACERSGRRRGDRRSEREQAL